MSHPIAITFHFPSSSSSPSGSSSSKRKLATNNRISTPYITIDKPIRKSKPSSSTQIIPQPPITSNVSTTSTSTSSSITTTNVPKISTGSKRRKGPVFVIPPPDIKLASLTPLLKPIVDRCSISSNGLSNTSTIEESLYDLPSPSRKRNKKSSTNIVTPFIGNPYSRYTDLSNNRSNVPSPKEIEKSKKLELEKIKLKKENAALARLNAISKRKSNRKTTTGGGRGGSRLPRSRRGSFENNNANTSKPTSPEEKNVPVITTQPASEENSPLLGNRNGLKRTRSQGVLPISTTNNITTNNSIMGSPVIGSPLKEVMSREEGLPRKKSKLSTEEPESFSSNSNSTKKNRRANTHSPTSNLNPLPSELDERLTKTVPLSNGNLLPTKLRASSQTPENIGIGLGSTLLRRSVSNSTPTYNRSDSVTSSIGSTSDNGRIKRETQLPERLKDYDMKAAV